MESVTISDCLRTHAQRRPNHPAYVYLHDSITWKELDRRVEALAAGLWARGIRHQDVVAVCVTDGPVQIEVVFALARLGAIRVGLNYRYSPADVEKLLLHSGAKLLIIEDAFASLAGNLCLELGILSAGDAQDGLGEYGTLVDAMPPKASRPEPQRSNIAQICYTTGSTGSPKGAVWSHRAVMASMGFTLLDVGMREDDIYLHCLPAAGVPSVNATWNVMVGCTSIIMPRFQAEQALELIERYRCTTALFIPTMLTAICETAEKQPRNVSSMRKILYGSAPTPPALVRRSYKVFGSVEFEQLYGSTEGAGGYYTKLTPADHDRALAGKESLLTSCGKPMVHARVRIVDENGEVCETGKVGEIAVSGPFVMDEYLREEELTSHVLRDGWLLTGDMGSIDEEGYVYLTDRKQFLIITGGYNVYPIEIENVVAAHPSVLEVCAFGVPDDKWGEAVHIAVVPRNGCSIDATEIRTWCRDKLAKFKIPKSVEIRDVLIRGATGKILKRAERERFLQGD